MAARFDSSVDPMKIRSHHGFVSEMKRGIRGALAAAALASSTPPAPAQSMFSTPPLVAPVGVVLRPDLVIPSLGATDWVRNRDGSVRVTFTYRVRNAGPIRSGSFLVRLRLTGIRDACRPPTWSRSHEILLVQALGPGQETRGSWTATFTAREAHQQYAVFDAVVDPWNQVRESNEANNVSPGGTVALDEIGSACVP